MSGSIKQLVDFVKTARRRIDATYRSFLRRGWNARLDDGPRDIHARCSHKCLWRQGWDEADKKLKLGLKIRHKTQ